MKPWSMNSCIMQELNKKYNISKDNKTILKKRKRKEEKLKNQHFKGFKLSVRLDILKKFEEG